MSEKEHAISTSTDHLSVYVDPQYIEVDAGKSVNLTCIVSTSKPYTVTWLKDGRAISKSPGKTGNFGTEHTYSLFMSSVHRENDGMYQCHIKSESSSNGVQGTAEIVLASKYLCPFFVHQVNMDETKTSISLDGVDWIHHRS